jgi:5-formyltetrahydrofolate cyclo-ligase
MQMLFDAAHPPTLREKEDHGPVTLPEEIARDKAALRSLLRSRRRERTEDERAEVARALAVRLGSVPGMAELVAGSGALAAYASMPGEPGTQDVRALCAASGVRVALPVIGEEGALDWAWDHGDLAPGPRSRGIPEPTGDVVGHGADGLVRLGVAIVLVPALAVDRAGRRLGQGGGSYDRLLDELDHAAGDPHPHVHPRLDALGAPTAGHRPLLVAVVHDDELLEELPAAEHDRPVDAVLTPSAYHSLVR